MGVVGRCRPVFDDATITLLSTRTLPLCPCVTGPAASLTNGSCHYGWGGSDWCTFPWRSLEGRQGSRTRIVLVLNPARNDAESESTVPRANGVPAVDPRARVPVLPVLHGAGTGRAGQPERGRPAHHPERRQGRHAQGPGSEDPRHLQEQRPPLRGRLHHRPGQG